MSDDRQVLLVEIGAGDLPNTTPAAPVAASWFPVVYTPPPPPVPGNFAVAAIVGGVRASWDAVAGSNIVYELQRAPDNAGAPGAWATVRTSAELIYNANESATTWWRVRSVQRGNPSAYSAQVSQTPTAVPTPAEVAAAQASADAANLLASQALRPIKSYEFAGAALPAGITIENIAATSSNGGSSTVLTATAEDPKVRFSPNVPGKNCYAVLARVRLVSGAWDGGCVYVTAGHGETGAYSKAIAAPPVGVWTTVVWDMRVLTSGGTDFVDAASITGVRLDFMTHNGDEVEVDWIAIGEFGQVSQGDVNTAQTLATNAQADATNALGQLTDIASDGKLTANEKLAAKQRYNAITAEQSGIDAQATAYAVTAEKTNYDNAVTALKTYLKDTVGVLDAGYVWTDITGTDAIARSTWDTNWNTVYTTRQALLNKIYELARAKAEMSSGANLVLNPNFSSNAVGTALNASLASTATATDGWTTAISAYHHVVVESSGGTNNILIRLRGDVNIPANSGAIESDVYSSARFDVEPSRKYRVSGSGSCDRNATPPAGVDIIYRTSIYWFKSDGTFLYDSSIDYSNTFGAITISGELTAPADAARAEFRMRAFVINTTASAVSAAGAVWADSRWKYVAVKLVNNLDTEVLDGTTYGRYAVDDRYYDGTKYRVGLRVPGSGHRIGNLKNLPQVLTNAYISIRSAGALTATSAGAISVNAHTVYQGASSTSYTAVSNAITGLSQGAVGWVYCIDPGYAGGTQTWLFTANINDVMNGNDGVVVAGKITIPSSGSSGGGGAGDCVAAGMQVIERARGIIRAGDVKPGDYLRRGNGTWGLVTRSDPRTVPGLRLVGDDLAELECSTTAPMQTGAGFTLATDMLGKRTPAFPGERLVMDVVRLGLIDVQHIALAADTEQEDDHVFVVSHDGVLWWAHHNLKA